MGDATTTPIPFPRRYCMIGFETIPAPRISTFFIPVLFSMKAQVTHKEVQKT
jgi:hypothetical protein